MPAKTPMYLKTSTPKKGKRLRLRDLLSGDMISPPLGDVRHSAHVGAEGQGDMFGDVGFLQGKLDMLPSQSRPQNGHARSHSVERRAGGGGGAGSAPGNGGQEAHSYAYNGFHYQHAANGLLKTTVSMPVFIAHEQAPPKPPRLHLEDAAPHRPPPPAPPCGNGVPPDPCRDIALSPAVRRLVPSSGSFSEVSSEDSMSEAGGPLDARRGLSLDSDAGLSNEDLRSERSESPCGGGGGCGGPPAPACSAVSRADSMAGLDLDLDLGPSILEDVLSIMDRYKATDDRCEL